MGSLTVSDLSPINGEPRIADITMRVVLGITTLQNIRRLNCWTTAHRQMTIDQAVASIAERHGEDRTPSRSSIGRFWKTMDLMFGAGH
jgi:hypothetical protein